MSSVYKTKQGDTWDIIAKSAYGDETKIGILMQNNVQYIDIWVFNAGCLIEIPDIENEEDEDDDFPDWREDEEDDEEEYEEDDDE